MDNRPNPGNDVRSRLQSWDRAVWSLAALALACGPDREDLTGPAEAVLATLGLPRTREELESSTRVPPTLLAAQAGAPVLQVARLLAGETAGWASMPDEALLAQGRGSAQMAGVFETDVLPEVPELADALDRDGARMLDVGTGVGQLALAFAEAFPRLHVTGIDVMPRVLEMGERSQRGHPAEHRVRFLQQDVADLAAEAEFDLVWLPTPFLPESVLAAGMRACARALKPGGWLMLAHGNFGDDPLEDALNRLKTACFGGSSIDRTEAVTLVRSAGLDDLRSVGTPSGAPRIILGRAPTAR